MGRHSGRYPRTKVRPHTLSPDVELSRGTGRVWCGTCGLPGEFGDARHYPQNYADDHAAELVRQIIGERN